MNVEVKVALSLLAVFGGLFFSLKLQDLGQAAHRQGKRVTALGLTWGGRLLLGGPAVWGCYWMAWIANHPIP